MIISGLSAGVLGLLLTEGIVIWNHRHTRKTIELFDQIIDSMPPDLSVKNPESEKT